MEVQRNIREDIPGCKAEMRLGAEDDLASNVLDVLVRGSRGLALKGSSLESSDGLAFFQDLLNCSILEDL
jgi:hypothetical protein